MQILPNVFCWISASVAGPPPPSPPSPPPITLSAMLLPLPGHPEHSNAAARTAPATHAAGGGAGGRRGAGDALIAGLPSRDAPAGARARARDAAGTGHSARAPRAADRGAR